MALTERQVWTATKIDTRMQKLIRAGKDDMEIMVAMANHMQALETLMEAITPEIFDELTSRFSGLHRYAKILEAIAQDIKSGTIKV